VIAVVCGWEGDLSVSSTGDIGAAPVLLEAEQRIIRRLLTNPGDYIWHLDYGAGLGSYVGQLYSPKSIESTILIQMQSEPLVATSPSPTVQVAQAQSGSFSTTSASIQYYVLGTSVLNSVIVPVGS